MDNLPPLKSWQFFNACRKILGDSYLQKLFKRSLRQIYRWSADPDFCDDTERNPIDRYEVLLERLVEIGRDDIAIAAVKRQLQIVGLRAKHEDEIVPDKDDWRDEILDDLPALAEFHKACQGYIQGREWAETVVHWCDEAIREIKETKVKVLADEKKE